MRIVYGMNRTTFTSNRRTLIAVSLIAGSTFVGGTVSVDADAEREALARVIHESV